MIRASGADNSLMTGFEWPRRQQPVLFAAVWLSLVGLAFFILVRYSLTPGRRGTPPAQWPAASGVTRERSEPTLVLVLHPHCPCSRATLAELTEVMTQCQGRLGARILFVRPSGLPDPWVKTDLWRTAQSIPGVVPVIDRDGAEAARFGSYTSGQVALYDHGGALVFRGGITGARGHVGANPGAQAVVEFVSKGAGPLHESAVYGCPLKAPSEPDSITDHSRCLSS
jgi:hypothetical protein